MVLAPNANVTAYGNLTGTLAAASLTQYSELHSASFTGDLSFLPTGYDQVVIVREPSGWALMAGMLPLFALLRRRARHVCVS